MVDTSDPAAELQSLFQEEWEAHLQDDPFFATVTGDKRYNDRLPEASEAQAERQAQRLRGFLSRLERIDHPHPSAKAALDEPFTTVAETVPGSERDRLQAEARRVIEGAIVPAYRTLLRFMEETYLPGARTTIAAADLPDGKRFYEHRGRMNVSLPVAPAEVHQTGLREVMRIRQEMDAVRGKVGFAGDHAAFGEYLRREPRFYVDTPAQLMKEVAFILKRMDGELPRLFRTLPRLPYGIKPVPDYVAPQTTTAYYWEGAGDGTRAGAS